MGGTATVLAEGLCFGEGPRWRDGRLWFSDFYDRAVKSVSLAGDVRVEFTIDDQPSGLGWLADGSMLIVAMRSRRVLKRSISGVVSVHADLGALATFHANDMVVDPAGGAYVGNFGFDLEKAFQERGRQSVMADHPTATLLRIAPDGTVKPAAENMHFPNGSVITPDGRTLIVAETLAARLTAFDIEGDGALANRRIFAETTPRIPDGIALDADGAVWIANARAPECARIAAGGRTLDVMETSQPCFACMLGGEDGRTLFALTAPSSGSATAAAERRGRIEIGRVDSPHAGWP